MHNDAFRRWFANSKVVDESGAPLVVWHGSMSEPFNEFDPARVRGHAIGFHFGTREAAQTFLPGSITQNNPKYVRPFYLRIVNPLSVSDMGEDWYDLIYSLPLPREEQERLYYEIPARRREERGDVLRSLLMRLGYDGIEYENEYEDEGSTSWVAFSPHQIKSAVGNDTFDPASPNVFAGLERAPDWSRATMLDPNHRAQCSTLPSSTVTKSWSSSPQERYVTHRGRIRQLTPEEVFRLQGFPDGWFDVPGVPNTTRVGLAGNAVPPPVAKVMFQALGRVDSGRTVLELFAGAGGMALGATQAGFNVKGLVDLWPPACAVLRSHFPAKAVKCMSVDDVKFETLRGLDVLSGGPPCQPFSRGGRRLGADDPRDRCTALPLILAAMQPRSFIFEESDQLFTHEGGAYWRSLSSALRRAKPGYRLAAMLINAHDFGVPQIRCRAFVVGLRQGDPRAWASAVLAQARPGQGGIVADVMRGTRGETWGPWEFGCQKIRQSEWCRTRVIEAD
jgi:site-specific DNA-cytosine methylase